MGLRTGEPAGLQSSGKGFGMAGREAGRNCCSSRRHLQGATNAHVRVLPELQTKSNKLHKNGFKQHSWSTVGSSIC